MAEPVKVVPVTAVDPVELGKQAAAKRAVDDFLLLRPLPLRIGIGSGSTVVYIVEYLRARASDLNKTFRCVPTSFQSRQLIIGARPELQLSSLEEEGGELDIAFDGADEVDEKLNCIKGGGACMLQEKCVASASIHSLIHTFQILQEGNSRTSAKITKSGIILRWFSFFRPEWKKGVPLEVLPVAYSLVRRRLTSPSFKPFPLKPKLRFAVQKAGPVVTDNGNFVMDAIPETENGLIDLDVVIELEKSLQGVVGILETGLFLGMANAAYFGDSSGQVVIQRNKD